jgi:plasmid stabilization system protein ParE
LSKFTLDWTSTAIADLKATWDYIAIDNEAAADRTIDRIQAAAETLTQFPKAGRASRLRGSREFVVTGTPYFLVYEMAGSLIKVRRVIHGARDWPPKRRRA